MRSERESKESKDRKREPRHGDGGRGNEGEENQICEHKPFELKVLEWEYKAAIPEEGAKAGCYCPLAASFSP